jgi:AAA domain
VSLEPVGPPGDRVEALWATQRASGPAFKALGEGSYRFFLPAVRSSLEVDFLRRDGGQLKGEVLVRCELAGSRSIDGILTVSDVNLSSIRTRASFAKDLEALARTKPTECDWRAVVEEFSLRVLAAERNGEPALWLADVMPPASDRLLYVDGFPLLERHPLILFGDGGTGKSLLALYFAGHLAQKGRRVGLFDWELDAAEHRLRLGHLFPSAPLPRIRYVRCSHPLCREAERLRRVVKEADLDYIVFDSVGYACDGPPEAAEQAMRYFQSLRTLGQVGSLHIAHVRGSVEGGDLRPFGSVFWNNSARATWNIKPAAREADESRLQVALHHRKYNTSGRMRSVGFEVTFEPGRTSISSLELGRVPDLAAQLGLGERVRLALKGGPLDRAQLRAELEDVKDNRFRSIISKEKKAGRVLEFPEGRFSLHESLFGGS